MDFQGIERSTSEDSRSRAARRWRRTVVLVLALLVGVVACGIVSPAFVRGSWWYSYGTDHPLDDQARFELRAIRDRVESTGTAPDTVTRMGAALDPRNDPSDVRLPDHGAGGVAGRR